MRSSAVKIVALTAVLCLAVSGTTDPPVATDQDVDPVMLQNLDEAGLYCVMYHLMYFRDSVAEPVKSAGCTGEYCSHFVDNNFRGTTCRLKTVKEGSKELIMASYSNDLDNQNNFKWHPKQEADNWLFSRFVDPGKCLPSNTNATLQLELRTAAYISFANALISPGVSCEDYDSKVFSPCGEHLDMMRKKPVLKQLASTGTVAFETGCRPEEKSYRSSAVCIRRRLIFYGNRKLQGGWKTLYAKFDEMTSVDMLKWDHDLTKSARAKFKCEGWGPKTWSGDCHDAGYNYVGFHVTFATLEIKKRLLGKVSPVNNAVASRLVV